MLYLGPQPALALPGLLLPGYVLIRLCLGIPRDRQILRTEYSLPVRRVASDCQRSLPARSCWLVRRRRDHGDLQLIGTFRWLKGMLVSTGVR